jgi:uncharacterized protein
MTLTDVSAIEPSVDVALVAATFGDLLHRAGVSTTPERSGRFADVLALVRPATVSELYWSTRVAFVIDRRDIEAFDGVFGQVFRGRVDVVDVDRNPDVDPLPTASSRDRQPPPATDPGAARSSSTPSERGITVPGDDGQDEGPEPADDAVVAAAATREITSTTPFSACSPEELDALAVLIARLHVVPPLRRGRRGQSNRHRGDVQWRATLRRARRTGGDPIVQIHRRRVDRPRRIVLIADVSGSMEMYARAYLHLLHGAVRAVNAEAFVFATRLTRLTRHLTMHDPSLALAQARAAAPDWAGGTRIGEALREFNDGWGRRGMARGAVVVIVSDGWEAGDTSVVSREMERLSRLAHRIVWVNPRRQSPLFRPVTGGMAAALPFVDSFVSGHSLAGLDEVLAAIAGDQTRRPTTGTGDRVSPRG